MLLYITGVAGTGKSSVVSELNKRGIKAFDLDFSGLCYWINKKGERANYKTGIGSEWIEKYDYMCDKGKLKELIDSQKEKLFVVAGITDNQNEYLDWFDKVFILQCNQDILLNRLINRDTNDFAKERSEQEFVLNMQKDFDEDILKRGAISIDSHYDVREVTDKILSYIQKALRNEKIQT